MFLVISALRARNSIVHAMRQQLTLRSIFAMGSSFKSSSSSCVSPVSFPSLSSQSDRQRHSIGLYTLLGLCIARVHFTRDSHWVTVRTRGLDLPDKKSNSPTSAPTSPRGSSSSQSSSCKSATLPCAHRVDYQREELAYPVILLDIESGSCPFPTTVANFDSARPFAMRCSLDIFQDQFKRFERKGYGRVLVGVGLGSRASHNCYRRELMPVTGDFECPVDCQADSKAHFLYLYPR